MLWPFFVILLKFTSTVNYQKKRHTFFFFTNNYYIIGWLKGGGVFGVGSLLFNPQVPNDDRSCICVVWVELLVVCLGLVVIFSLSPEKYIF